MEKNIIITAICLSMFLLTSCGNKTIKDNTLETTGAKNELEDMGKIETATIKFDASQSMKGYFISNKPDFINDISELIDKTGTTPKIYFVGQPKPYMGLLKDILSDLQKQPNDATSSFEQLFADMCKDVQDNDIQILMSDGIVSVGRNTDKALKELKNKVKNKLKTYSGTRAMAILKYSAPFVSNAAKKAFYFNKDDKSVMLNFDERPFYVFVVGAPKTIRALQKMDTSAEQKLFFGIHDSRAHDMSQSKQTPSNLKLEKPNDPTKITIQLPKCLKDYSIDYLKSNLYVLKNVTDTITKGLDIDITSNLYVTISIDNKFNPYKGDNGKVSYVVGIKNTLPEEWKKLSSDDDTNIGANISQKSMTFGLKYLLEAVMEGLQPEKDLINVKYEFKQ